MGILQEVSYAFRSLRRTPGFAVVAVLTLALGVGVNTAIFSVVHAMLLRPLPYADPDRLVYIWETRTSQEFRQREASYPNFADWQKQNSSFESLAGYNSTNFTLIGGDSPERISATRITSNFFTTLGVRPALGRDFRSEEEQASATPVMLISYGFWQRYFAGSADALGQTVNLSGVQYTVIGVLPQSFQFALNTRSEAWLPLAMTPDQASRRTFHWLRPIARLKPGVSLAQAQAELAGIADRLAAEHPASNAATGVGLVPLHERITGEIKPVLLVLYGAALLVLLIACVNIANLLLARAAGRSREIAVRVALGAGRARLVRLLLTESTLLAAMGGLAGLLLAWWSVDALIALTPPRMLASFPALTGLQLTPGIFVYHFGLALAAGTLFGLAPAYQASRISLNDALKQAAPGMIGGTQRLRNALVAVQVAVALMLVTGTSLMVQSLDRLLAVNPGFTMDHLVSVQLSLPPAKYDPQQVIAFYRDLRERAAALPGVKDAAVIDELPLTGDGGTVQLYAEGRPQPPPGKEIEGVYRTAGPNYFQLMGIPVLSGRMFTEQDAANAPRRIILTQSLARRLFESEDPVGRRVVMGYNNSIWEVVGVVSDVKMADLEKTPRPALYVCALQSPSRSSYLVVRTSMDAASVAAAVRAEVKSLDAELPVYGVRTMDQVIGETSAVLIRRSVRWLMGGFAVLAFALATIGLFGVISYNVTQRTREIGIRIALGAQPGSVLWLVLRRGLLLSAAGIVMGAAAALALGGSLRTLLYGVTSSDPRTYFFAAALLLLTAALASAVPACRAARVNPIVALRDE